jgi:rare lipoprotein A
LKASCIALVAVVITLSTRTVEADAPLPRPVATAPPAAPVKTATPEAVAPERAASARRTAVFRGLASWYGGIFHGRLTASGERFDMYALTACHPTLPFGTIVRVVNLVNKQSVVVKITDRRDFIDGRIIDLSYAAAQQLAMTEAGLVPVRLEVLSRGMRPFGN